LGKDTSHIDSSKKVKLNNTNDEAHGLIKMSISIDLHFCLQGVNDPYETWENMETIFDSLKAN